MNLTAVVTERIAALDEVNVYDPVFNVEGHGTTQDQHGSIVTVVDGYEANSIVAGVAEPFDVTEVRIEFAGCTVPGINCAFGAVRCNC